MSEILVKKDEQLDIARKNYTHEIAERRRLHNVIQVLLTATQFKTAIGGNLFTLLAGWCRRSCVATSVCSYGPGRQRRVRLVCCRTRKPTQSPLCLPLQARAMQQHLSGLTSKSDCNDPPNTPNGAIYAVGPYTRWGRIRGGAIYAVGPYTRWGRIRGGAVYAVEPYTILLT